MALREIHAFLTRYIRDPYFREQWKGAGASTLRNELGLSDADLETLKQIPLNELDAASEGMRSDRINKRRTEFAQFLDHLSLYVPVDEFLNAYDAAHTTGRESIAVEIDWFLSFSIKFVASNGLPEYLIALARFCHLYTKLAFMPLKISDNTLDNPRESGLEFYHTVKLYEPFRIEDFRYDALEIANSAPGSECAYTGTPTRLLFLKSRHAFKRSTIWNVTDLPPYISALIEGPKMLSDLVGMQAAGTYSEIFDDLLHFHDSGVIEFIVPPHHLV